MSKLITVFTPTYNRENTLVRLYESLIRQTSNNFTWLIVDDGSIDNTKEIVDTWISDKKIDIRYFKQENQGKSMAHNKGVELTETELFVCVDSDDYLANEAIYEIENKWKENEIYSTGIVSPRYISNKPYRKIKDDIKSCTLKDAYDKFGLFGDTMLVIKVSILKKYEFPCFEGEKFVPEAYLYDLIDQEGKFLVLNKPLYMCEYLEGGYTNNMARLLKNNARGYFAYIKQRINFDVTIKEKFFDYIRYIAMAKCVDYENIWEDKKDVLLKILSYPFGIVLYIKKFKNIK